MFSGVRSPLASLLEGVTQMRARFWPLPALVAAMVCLGAVSVSRWVVGGQAPSRAASAAAEKADLSQSGQPPAPLPAVRPSKPVSSEPKLAPAPTGQPQTLAPLPRRRFEVRPPVTPSRRVPQRPGNELPAEPPEGVRPTAPRPAPPTDEVFPRFPEPIGKKPPWDSQEVKATPEIHYGSPRSMRVSSRRSSTQNCSIAPRPMPMPIWWPT